MKRCMGQIHVKNEKKVCVKFRALLLASPVDIDLFTLQKNVSNLKLQESESRELRHVYGTVAPESSRS